jgi:hypothetical protein
MDLTLNKPKEFGYEFLFNYEQSLNQYNKDLYEAKTLLLEQLKGESDVVARDIQGKFLKN